MNKRRHASDMPIHVKAVLTDAGGILFDDTYGGKVIYPAIAGMLNKDVKTLQKEFEPYKLRAQTAPGYTTKQAWADYLADNNRPQDDTRKVSALYEQSWAGIAAYQGVPEAVAELGRKGIKVIVLTDAATPGKDMEARIRGKYGIDEGLTGLISSKDLGVTKPDKRFFDTALAEYGLTKEDVVFLAHDYDELKGAHDLGFRVLALHYDKDDDLSFIPEQRKLKSISDLPKAVRP